MGSSDSEGRCRRHPKHRQSKGVCPSCLRERLSQLSASSSTNNSSYLSSPGSYYDSVSSSAHSSSSASPSTNRRRPRRRDVGAKIALLMRQNGVDPLQGSKPEPLTKSRSLAFVIPNPLGGAKKDKKDRKVKMEEKNKAVEGNEDDGKVEEGKEEKKKQKWFWSKLAVGGKKRKEKDALFHSKTVRETSSARWTFLP